MILLLVLAVTTVLGCGTSSPPADVTPPVALTSVRLSTHSLQLAAGEEQRVDLQGVTVDGAVVSLANVQWTAPPEAAVNGTGGSVVVRAKQGGQGWLVARASGLADSALVEIQPQLVAGNRVLLDMRQSLQQATTIDRAFALFGVVDHTPYRGARNITGGWNFTTNADGNGLHALRVDWQASQSNDQGIRVIDYLPDPKPAEVYIRFKSRIGRYAADVDANGAPDSYAVFPQSNACKRALISQISNNRIDLTLHRSVPEVAKLEVDQYNYAVYSDASVWNFNSQVGQGPYTTTIYLKVASAAGRNDGVYRVWMNGTLLIDRHDVPTDATPIDRWEFPATCTMVPQPQSEYFWDILVWTP